MRDSTKIKALGFLSAAGLVALALLFLRPLGGHQSSGWEIPRLVAPGQAAPDFRLESVGSVDISLRRLASAGNVLLFFSMGYG